MRTIHLKVRFICAKYAGRSGARAEGEKQVHPPRARRRAVAFFTLGFTVATVYIVQSEVKESYLPRHLSVTPLFLQG